MNKNLKKILVASISLLMVTSIGTEINNSSFNVGAKHIHRYKYITKRNNTKRKIKNTKHSLSMHNYAYKLGYNLLKNKPTNTHKLVKYLRGWSTKTTFGKGFKSGLAKYLKKHNAPFPPSDYNMTSNQAANAIFNNLKTFNQTERTNSRRNRINYYLGWNDAMLTGFTISSNHFRHHKSHMNYKYDQGYSDGSKYSYALELQRLSKPDVSELVKYAHNMANNKVTKAENELNKAAMDMADNVG